MNNAVMKYRSNIHPKKFGLWVGLGSIAMMFTAFTSAYIVRQAAGNWLEFQLPDIFFVSTGAILLSSLTIQTSYYAFKKEYSNWYRGLLSLTLILGLAFVYLQYQGWLDMHQIGINLTGNPSGSFVYVISGVHAAHVLGGIAILLTAIFHAFTLPFQVTKKRLLRFELALHYWHFIGILWVYLLLFFMFQR